MKIRYYLRGLGLGILFTAIFFLVSNNSSSQTMSDEQIKARAKELGMIESTVLAELPAQETESAQEETTVETTFEEIVTEGTVSEGTSEEKTSTEAETAEENMDEETAVEETSEETAAEESEPKEIVEEVQPQEEETATEHSADNTTPVTVVVNRGEGSDTVSRRLAELGLVADAHEYDKYLMTNGYDKRIGAGEHVIPVGATWEEIAKILCNQM